MFEWLPERIEQAKIISDEFEQGWNFRLNPPATKADIDSCEAALGIPLPPSYREFLLRWNGAYLFRIDDSQSSDDPWDGSSLIHIQGTQYLLEFNQEVKDDLTAEEWDSLILFAYGCYGDYCGLDPQQTTNWEYAVLDCDHDSHPVEWRQAKIASSFAEWLEKIFDQVINKKKLPEYWIELESPSTSLLAENTPSAIAARMNAWQFYDQGKIKIQNNDYKGAIEDFTQALLLWNKYERVYYERGNVLSALTDYSAAVEDYNQAIGFGYEAAYNKRGVARAKLGDQQGAIADFDQILCNPSKYSDSFLAEVYINRGNVRSELEDRQGAFEDYQRAAKYYQRIANRYQTNEAMSNYQNVLDKIQQLQQ